MKANLLNHFRETGAGMGVGLAGMRERVRDLGGKLKVESDGSGTFVRITIPVTPDWFKVKPKLFAGGPRSWNRVTTIMAAEVAVSK